MKKTFILLLSGLVIIGCGTPSANNTEKKDTTATAPETISTANEKGLELIGSSDCTTCHRLDQAGTGATIGPAYSEVAKKYAPAPDSTFNRLVKKIITGGQGVWGNVPMTPHPALKEEDVREMVKYILSLKK